MSFPNILHNESLELELVFLLTMLSIKEINKFAKTVGSKKYCRKTRDAEAEHLALKEVERALEAAITDDFSGYRLQARRPQRMRTALINKDRLVLAETIISIYNSSYLNNLKIVLQGRKELEKEILEVEGVEVEAIKEGVRREGDDQLDAENIVLSKEEKEELKNFYNQKYIKTNKKEEAAEPQPQPQLLELEPKTFDNYIYQAPANNPTYQKQLLFYYTEGA